MEIKPIPYMTFIFKYSVILLLDLKILKHIKEYLVPNQFMIYFIKYYINFAVGPLNGRPESVPFNLYLFHK